jgi:hypothetical protein
MDCWKYYNICRWQTILAEILTGKEAPELTAARSQLRFPMVSLQFFIDIILPAAIWPWDRLSL